MANFSDRAPKVLPTKIEGVHMRDISAFKLFALQKEANDIREKYKSPPNTGSAVAFQNAVGVEERVIHLLFRELFCDENGDAFDDVKNIEDVRKHVGVNVVKQLLESYDEIFLGKGSTATNQPD